jgi:5-methylcytosine-specific restriction endonuclease McrA
MRGTRKSVHAQRFRPTNTTTRPKKNWRAEERDGVLPTQRADVLPAQRSLCSRTPISKKIRFEIFKRDGFRCVYCGAVPSETVLLECDHIKPVGEGGSNEADNLVTACGACNSGKGATPLSSVPQSLEEKAAQVAEREAQIRAYHEIFEAKKARKDEELRKITDVFTKRFGDEEIHHNQVASIRNFLRRLDYFEVLEAMEIAVDRTNSPYQSFKYFCGVCWRKIKRAAGEQEGQSSKEAGSGAAKVRLPGLYPWLRFEGCLQEEWVECYGINLEHIDRKAADVYLEGEADFFDPECEDSFGTKLPAPMKQRTLEDLRDQFANAAANLCESPTEQLMLAGLLRRIRPPVDIWDTTMPFEKPKAEFVIAPRYQIGEHHVDFAIFVKILVLKEIKIIVECDSHENERRDRDVLTAGWKMLKFTGSEIRRNWNACVDRVDELIAEEIEAQRALL